MKWGEHEEWLTSEAFSDGPPKAIRNKPFLGWHLYFVWDAYHALSSDRPSGLSLSAIPFSSIDAYARRYGIDGIDDFDRFRNLIQRMDVAFLNYHEDIRKAQESSRNNGRNN